MNTIFYTLIFCLCVDENDVPVSVYNARFALFHIFSLTCCFISSCSPLFLFQIPSPCPHVFPLFDLRHPFPVIPASHVCFSFPVRHHSYCQVSQQDSFVWLACLFCVSNLLGVKTFLTTVKLSQCIYIWVLAFVIRACWRRVIRCKSSKGRDLHSV